MQKRILTDKEIDYILSDIKPVYCIENNISRRMFSEFEKTSRKQLMNKPIYPEMIEQLKDNITKHYYNSQVVPGDSVGILTAQSIGERQTQLSLDSFHSTGITTATVVTGVPRFNELVNTTKKPKFVLSTIYPKEECKTIEDIRLNLGIHMKHLTMKDIVKNVDTINQEIYKKDLWYETFNLIHSQNIPSDYNCIIRLYCDMEILFNYRLKLNQISGCVLKHYEDIYIVWSPNHLGIIDVWINTSCIIVPEELMSINDENKVDVYINEVVLPNIYNISINGVDGIESVNYVKPRDKDTWYIEASGFNLKKLLSLDIVDNTRTLSNHMWEIYETLGIEATREFLIQEFINTISVDSYINKRHIELLVDVMLYTGSISSISRYGVHKNQSGALTKCSFEESLDQILKAGIYGEEENINGVSGAIICGKVSNIGTGLCDLVYKPETTHNRPF
jgi:DNA-directed RNA polymerase beta' subunit